MAASVRHVWPAVILCGWLAAADATAKTRAAQPPAAQPPAAQAPAAPTAPAPPGASDLARSWDHVNFEIHNPEAQIAAADALAQQARAAASSRPGDPSPLIWEAAALLAKADARHDLSSLGLAKQARRLLEQATAQGASGQEGGFAYAVLGELYAQTPGFPLGFGDRKKARADFAKAIALAPDDIDVNVLYADFLLEQKDFQGAIEAARRALNAPPRPGREVGDKGRREEATQTIAKAERQTGQRSSSPNPAGAARR
jgi:tetratricopeptide (TPR) repeat protein